MADNINKELVKNTFDKQYNRGQFVNFIKELLNGVEERNTIHTNIPNQFKDYIKSYRRLGKYIYNDRFEKVTIDVIEVNLKRTSSLERARTMQRNFVARYLNGTFGAIQREAALVAFINEDEPQDWRFSLVKMDYKTEIQTDKRVIKVELTPAKRFSFLVGQNENTHTVQKQLFTCLEKSKKGEKITLEELTAAFNIEKVSQEFFDEYKKLFDIFCNELERICKSDSKVKKDFYKHNINVENFAKKTLGQLVFLYFIQKKGWLGVEKDKNWNSGDKKFLRTLFDKQNYNNFFNDILEPLFYEALAKERDTNSYYEKFDCRIPFLNGGLFEPINNYSWTTTNLTIKNDLFRTIFDVFDLYNFTVKEDEPLEKEVAIDPEMLGKVFENLLPENIKKGNGAFYTPREIVHYMCQESLINYLDTQINKNSKVIEKEDLSIFVKIADSVYINDNYGNSQTLPVSIKPNAKQIDKALENIKICDPAIGSGAFPVGIMTEIVRIRMALNDYLRTTRTSYDLKRNAIEKSIYGVDIDSGAVEIAKLRFYLSLVVDEEEPKNIRPLPNLDFKIMQGNSLISSYENIDFDKIFDSKSKNISQDVLFGEKPKTQSELFSNETDNVIKEIQQKLREYINIPYASKKSQIRGKIEDLMMQLIKNKLENDEGFKGILSNFKNEKSRGLEKNLKLVEEKISNLIANRENRKFFPWKLFFADVFEKGGFDIVIGNPPYGVSIKGDYRKSVEESLGKVPDYEIYYYFINIAYKLLKENAILSYIIPNTWLFNTFASKYRIDLLNRWAIKEILDCSRFEIFESATVRNTIVLFKKNISNCVGYRRTKNINNFTSLITNPLLQISKDAILKINQNWGLAFLLDNRVLEIVNKISKNIYDVNTFYDSSQGYIPYRKSDLVKVYGKNKAENIVKKRLWHSEKKEDDTYIQEIFGRDFNKYSYKKQNSFVKYGKHLATYVDLKYFNQTRILVREITNPTIIACMVSELMVNDPQIITIIPKNNTSKDLKILWAILNSKLATFYHFNHSPKATKGAFPKILVKDIKEFPLPNIDCDLCKKISECVKNIFKLTNAKDYLEHIDSQNKVKEYEKQIDVMVYKLYELNYEEILIIDKDFKLSKEEYNSFKL